MLIRHRAGSPAGPQSKAGRLIGRIFDPQKGGIGRKVHLDAPRIGHLRDQADIRHGRAHRHGRIARSQAVACQHRLQRREAGGYPMLLPVGTTVILGAQPVTQILQHAQIVERVDVAGDRIARSGARARARRHRVGSSGGSGTISSRYSMMASDWPIAWPSCTSVGISSCGLTRLVGVAVLLAAVLQQMDEAQSGLRPFRLSAMRTRKAAEERK